MRSALRLGLPFATGLLLACGAPTAPTETAVAIPLRQVFTCARAEQIDVRPMGRTSHRVVFAPGCSTAP